MIVLADSGEGYLTVEGFYPVSNPFVRYLEVDRKSVIQEMRVIVMIFQHGTVVMH